MRTWWDDLRLALRQLIRAKVFTALVIAVLGLAIGANATVLSLLHAIVWQRVAVPHAGRLVTVSATDPKGQTPQPIFHATFAQLATLPVFDAAVMYHGGGLVWIETRGVTGEGFIEAVTPGFHELLGLTPQLGRFLSDEDAPGDAPAATVTVISHRLWQRAYGGSPSVVGETLLVNTVPYTIIGVTPPHYTGLYVESGVDFAVPLGTLGRSLATTQYPLDPARPLRAPQVLARLGPGATLDAARATLAAAWPALNAATLPARLGGDERRAAEIARPQLESAATGFSRLRTRYGGALGQFTGITLAFLLIGATNVAGLLVARAAARRHEFALHAALGAPSTRLARRVLIECAALAAGGTLAGLLIAFWAAPFTVGFLWDGSVPLQLDVRPSPLVAAAATTISLALSALIGAGAWVTLKPNAADAVAARRPAKAGRRWLAPMLVAQVAASFALTVLAGLFVRTLVAAATVEHGVDGGPIRWMRALQQPGGYRDLDEATYYQELVRTVAAVPGVEQVALSHHFPAFFNFANQVATFPMARAELDAATVQATGMMEYLSPAFFDTIGVPLLAGRDFTWQDNRDAPPVAIVNRSLARALFGEADAVGRRLRIGNDAARQAVEIVGVAEDATMGGLETRGQPVAFRPKLQEPRFIRMPIVLVRTSRPAADINPHLAAAVQQPGREYVRRVYSFEEQLRIATFEQRLHAGLASGLALLALLLAGAGLFAQLAYAVATSTMELAVRSALGATRAAAVGLVLRSAFAAVGLGVLLGIPLSAAALRVNAWWQPDSAGWDPLVVAAAAGLFAVVTITAAFYPAWRAASVDPATSLRAE